jgi:hypothetical protein
MASASTRQASCGSPSTSTVQAPQVPWPQPYFGRQVADLLAQRIEQVLPVGDEDGLVGAVEAELDRLSCHDYSLLPAAEQQPLENGRRHLAAIPGGGD